MLLLTYFIEHIVWNVIFEIYAFENWNLAYPTPGKQPFFEISEDDHPSLVTHARDHSWTLDFANAPLTPGVNNLAELVPSPRANARNGAPRHWLGDE
jgi:hypothetical protein